MLRGINRTMILNIIREKQPISRITISRLTGLNKSTVSSIISELIKEDLIFEQVTKDQNIGRNPVNLSLKLGQFFIGAINIDSSVTHLAVADIDGSIKGTSNLKTNPKNPAAFIDSCVKSLLKLCKQFGIINLEAVGVSISGIVDSKTMIVNFAPNLGWENINIGELLQKKLPKIKTFAVGNDAKSSALAELWFGNHDVDLTNFVFLSIGQGIGSGIVVENKLMNGEYQASGEFGHMVIFEGGEQCTCGNKGCWEAYASERAIINSYILTESPKKRNASDFVIQDIIKLAGNNDTKAINVLRKTGSYLGLGISNIIKAIDPHAIIIGGEIIQAWDIIYPEIMEVVTERAYFGKKKNIKIFPTSLVALPRLMGAITLAIEEIFDGFQIIA